MNQWKISAGTAGVLGKKKIRCPVLPTTAYIMLGENCKNRCQFCSQSQESVAKRNRLSRITWPSFFMEEVVDHLSTAYVRGDIKRICFQVVNDQANWENTMQSLAEMKKRNLKAICVSNYFRHVGQAKALLEAGAEKVCIALDGATAAIYEQAKKSDWHERWTLLTECAFALPGKITTHLIVGLGETEEEMVKRIADCMRRGIGVGLFAFTPIQGTPWSWRQPPSIGQYRRIQIAYQLLQMGYGEEVIDYQGGKICHYDVPALPKIVSDGKAFETTGCPDCNRPFYNERPGGVIYNYPRKLTKDEIEQAIQESLL